MALVHIASGAPKGGAKGGPEPSKNANYFFEMCHDNILLPLPGYPSENFLGVCHCTLGFFAGKYNVGRRKFSYSISQPQFLNRMEAGG